MKILFVNFNKSLRKKNMTQNFSVHSFESCCQEKYNKKIIAWSVLFGIT